MLFRDDYYFLSNFYPAPITIHGVTWPTAEHMYQACKSPDASSREQIRLHPSRGLKAFVRTIAIRPEWNKIRVECMRCILMYKFEQHPDLMKRLLAITEPLVEDNYWNDTFWGKCGGIGQNMLGKLLMEIRDQHQSPEP